MKQKLLIISDGNGVDVEFIKWPSLLKILTTKTLSITNRSIIGASNELMLNQLIEALTEPYDFAIIQWTAPQRLDVVANDFWSEQAKHDPVYHFNLVNSLGKKWWVTSKTINEHVRKYHDVYINSWQAGQRSCSYMLAAAELLKVHNVKFLFSLCYDFKFNTPVSTVIESYPWAWHEKYCGMSEFRYHSKYSKLDQGKPQPHPLVGLEWIDQVLRPSADFIAYDQQTYYNVEQSLLKNV